MTEIRMTPREKLLSFYLHDDSIIGGDTLSNLKLCLSLEVASKELSQRTVSHVFILERDDYQR